MVIKRKPILIVIYEKMWQEEVSIKRSNWKGRKYYKLNYESVEYILYMFIYLCYSNCTLHSANMGCGEANIIPRHAVSWGIFAIMYTSGIFTVLPPPPNMPIWVQVDEVLWDQQRDVVIVFWVSCILRIIIWCATFPPPVQLNCTINTASSSGTLA